MFQALFKRAERSIDQAVSKIAMRALAAVPLLIAAGFATAALTVKLVESYGAMTGYALMAVLFTVIGVVGLAIVGVNSRSGAAEEGATEEPEAAADNPGSQEEQTPDIGDLLTPEVRALMTSAMPVAIPGLLRGVGRNLPLIFVLAVVAFVISQFADRADQEGQDNTVREDGNQDAAVPTAASGAEAAAA